MKKWRLTIIILAMAAAGLLLSSFSFWQAPRNIFWRAAKPVSLVFSATFGKVPDFFKNLFYWRQMVRQNNNLVGENLNLQSRLAKLSEIEYENEILKKELGFLKSQDTAQTVPAAIIGHSPGGYLKSLVIDKGQNDGLQAGQAVISQGFLVGLLTQVRADNSEVTLITDYNLLVPVVLQQSRGTGLLRGGISGLTIEDIPLNIAIQKEENVTTSGLGGQIPAGVAVGKVLNVISKEGEIFQKAAVSSPIDFARLEMVFILKK